MDASNVDEVLREAVSLQARSLARYCEWVARQHSRRAFRVLEYHSQVAAFRALKAEHEQQQVGQ